MILTLFKRSSYIQVLMEMMPN